jgi:hypothetical protein
MGGLKYKSLMIYGLMIQEVNDMSFIIYNEIGWWYRRLKI